MEYRIKKHHNLKLPVYLPNSFAEKEEAENYLRELNNNDPNITYSVVYGQYYPETGGFAEFKE